MSRTLDAREPHLTAPVTAPDTSKPIKVWAFVGAVCLAFQVYVYAKWITGPYFEEVPSGPSEPPTAMKAALTIWLLASVAGALVCLYWFLVRPWRRSRTVSTLGLFCIAWPLAYWQDPLANYTNTLFTYNSWLPNRGSWANEIPGWSSPGDPGAMLPEPAMYVAPAYISAFLLLSLAGAWGMRRAKARWPRLTKPQLLGVTFVAFFLIDFPVEILWTRMGLYSYPGAPGWTIGEGHYYQLPIAEMLVAALFFTAISSFMYFRDDRGNLLIERGIDSVRATPAQKVGLRLLAATGATNVGLLIFYSIPVNLVALHSEEWPEDVQKRSYLTDYLCGEGTSRACPSSSLPIFKDGKTVTIDPDGKLVYPPGATPPASVPFDRGPLGGAE